MPYTKEDFIMIQDAMNAIKTAECENFIKDFGNPYGGYSRCSDPRLDQIYSFIQYTGHSATSVVITLRNCQHLLNNPQEWTELQNQYQT